MVSLSNSSLSAEGRARRKEADPCIMVEERWLEGEWRVGEGRGKGLYVIRSKGRGLGRVG